MSKRSGWAGISKAAKQSRTEEFELGYAVNASTGSRTLVVDLDAPEIPKLEALLAGCHKVFERVLFFLEQKPDNTRIKQELVWKGDPSAVFRLMRVSRFFRTTIQTRFPEKFFQVKFGHMHPTIYASVHALAQSALLKRPKDMNVIENVVHTSNVLQEEDFLLGKLKFSFETCVVVFTSGDHEAVSSVVSDLHSKTICALWALKDKAVNKSLRYAFTYFYDKLLKRKGIVPMYLDLLVSSDMFENSDITFRLMRLLHEQTDLDAIDRICVYGAKNITHLTMRLLLEFITTREVCSEKCEIIKKHFPALADRIELNQCRKDIGKLVAVLGVKDLQKVLKLAESLAENVDA